MKLSIQILLAFSVVLILSIIDTLSNYVLSVKVEKNTEFLNKSQDIIRNSSNLHKEMIQMQSSFRGYLLTLDTNFLTSYKEGIQNVPRLFSEQQNLIKDSREQSAILDSIKSLHQQWIGYSNALITSSRKIPSSNDSLQDFDFLFENRFKKQIGEKINNQVSQKFADFDKIEYKSRSIHSNNLISAIDRTHTISFTFFALTIIIGIASTVYIISLISKRIKTMVRLAENISHGNFTTLNDHRKDEMTSLSKSLNTMSVSLSKNINELEKRDAELDKFAYVVSHDLKAPVRGIHNVIKWIGEDLKNEISPEMKNYLDIIRQRTNRMEDLINGLLDYARVREKTPLEKTDVAELVKEIVATIVPRNFTIEIKELPVIITERLKLGQVFSNLISNSVKYTANENAKIEIGCLERQNFYEFSIRDNGIGIDPEYHKRIFEMFQTLREKDEKESSGVGLAIVKRILDEQHGIIRVNSNLGHGAEFIFTWPKANTTKNENE
jgi:signal transduction histidine kinase